MSHKQLMKVANYYQSKYNFKLSTAGFFSDVGDKITKVLKKFNNPKLKLRDFMETGSRPTKVKTLGRAKEEALAYADQLKRLLPKNIPEGFEIEVRNFSHDLGSYPEVVCSYNLGDEESEELATWISNNQPENWDSEALEALEKRKHADQFDLQWESPESEDSDMEDSE